MSLPFASLTPTISRIYPHFFKSLTCVSNSSLMKAGYLRGVMRFTGRSKSADPSRCSASSENASLDAGVPPPSACPLNIRDAAAETNIHHLLDSTKHPSISRAPSRGIVVAGRQSKVDESKLGNQTDREDEQYLATDRAPSDAQMDFKAQLLEYGKSATGNTTGIWSNARSNDKTNQKGEMVKGNVHKYSELSAEMNSQDGINLGDHLDKENFYQQKRPVDRTFDLNWNESEAQKKLPMDINVLVKVEPQIKSSYPEVGIQDLSEHISHVQSEKDHLTKEIGKVYNFLKDTEQLQTSEKNLNSFEMFQNFEKVKRFYFNAVKCVNSFKDLTGSLDNTNGLTQLVKQETILKGNQVKSIFKYPIDFNGSFGAHPRSHQGLLSPLAMSKRAYSTDKGTNKSDCLKATRLPCLQSTEIPGAGHHQKTDSKSVCEKICMPCCKPARDPPICFFPYQKQACKKLKNPRPAFSECKLLFEMKQVAPCECLRPRATSCKKTPTSSERCDKR